MAIQPIQLATIDTKKHSKVNQKDVSFGGLNPVVTLMDAIDRGGFAASFILQDFLGMAAPRIGTGLYRNHDKTGHLNWDFAKKEGVREILSGPSAFIIPWLMMKGITKISGAANNVPVDFINNLGETFAEYAQNNASNLTKQGYYEEVFKNVLNTSTDNKLTGKKLDEIAKDFAQRLIKIEEAKGKSFLKRIANKPVKDSAQDLTEELLHDFVKLRKQYLGVEKDKTIAEFAKADKKTISTSFKTFLTHMKNYSNDAINTTKKQLSKNPNLDIKNFVEKLGHRRSGTRLLSNASMILGVIGFFTLIPKLYNAATKGHDPGLNGLIEQNGTKKQDSSQAQNIQNNKSQDPSFTGGWSTAMTKMGKSVSENQGIFKKISDIFEFNGASMSVPAMVTILFGFCLPPRLVNAQSNTDRKEILFRDLTSFSAILFGAKALTKIFSDTFSKISGLALNIKPEGDKSIFKKVLNYLKPSGGIQVLDNDRIVANYSNVDSFKNGINDMFKFVDKHGGNVGKMLNLDKEIKEAATEILGEVPHKNMKLKDIISKFDAQKDSDSYKKITNLLSKKDNVLVKKAKTFNSAFGFASTVVLVPALMIWISKHCEKMTKKRIAEQQNTEQIKKRNLYKTITNTPSMEGFLKT